MIKVEKLTKLYRKSAKPAVDAVSFQVEEGEFFAFLGPNGAGKTTTISILTTTLSKSSGNVQIAGMNIEKQAAEVRSQIGIIFQNPSIDLNLTAEENMRFHAVLYGLYNFKPTFGLMPKEYRDQVQELASVVGLGDDLWKPVRTYSGGMKRKLEIIRSLMHNPKVLFLDEPTTGLDPASRKNLWQYLRQVRDSRGTTIFLTTHYLEEAEDADHVCIINDGKIVADGTPKEIKETLVQEYLLIDSDDRSALETELQRHKIDFTLDKYYKVELTGNAIEAQKLIQRIKTPLSYLQLHVPTLEDSYLEIISKQEEKEDLLDQM